jgi:hypothetical protein
VEGITVTKFKFESQEKLWELQILLSLLYQRTVSGCAQPLNITLEGVIVTKFKFEFEMQEKLWELPSGRRLTSASG